MSGFGTGPFGVVVYGVGPDVSTAAPPTTLTSSRKIDFVTGRYVLDDDGGFDGMDDTAQRVVLLVSGTVKATKKIDARTQQATRDAVRAALRGMTDTERSIRLEGIAVTSQRPGQTLVEVVFVNLRTGTRQTATARLSS